MDLNISQGITINGEMLLNTFLKRISCYQNVTDFCSQVTLHLAGFQCVVRNFISYGFIHMFVCLRE
jgi:hypothetical protein